MHVWSELQRPEKVVVGQKSVFGKYFNMNSKLEIMNNFPWTGSKLPTGSKKNQSKCSKPKKVSGGGEGGIRTHPHLVVKQRCFCWVLLSSRLTPLNSPSTRTYMHVCVVMTWCLNKTVLPSKHPYAVWSPEYIVRMSEKGIPSRTPLRKIQDDRTQQSTMGRKMGTHTNSQQTARNVQITSRAPTSKPQTKSDMRNDQLRVLRSQPVQTYLELRLFFKITY